MTTPTAITLAALGLIVVAIAMAPRSVRTFLATEWLALVRFIAAFAEIGAGVAFMRYAGVRWHLPPWQVALGIIVSIAAALIYILTDPKLRAWVKYLTFDQWRAIDDDTEREPSQAGRTSWVVLVVLVVAAVSLTLQEYFGDRGAFERWFPSPRRDTYHELKGFAWWSSWRVIGYVIIPIVAIACMPRERIRDYHLSARGFFKHLWIYVLMFALILPAVAIASTTEQFRHTYPFYRMANRSQVDLWTWEAFYAAQFVSLELFFRGFLLQGLRRALGANAIFVMIVPYCMIHYGKPMSETLGAIGAGVILGTLAMRTRSIWGGVLIHIGVATTMDVLALRGCPPIGSGRYCGS